MVDPPMCVITSNTLFNFDTHSEMTSLSEVIDYEIHSYYSYYKGHVLA
jgi:hypothetical protein